MTSLHPDTINRLSLGLVEKEKITPSQAIQKLRALQLNIQCGPAITQSIPLQGALLTAVNTGVRAFLGGVFLKMPDDTPCLLPQPSGSNSTLNEYAARLGATPLDHLCDDHFTITIGLPAQPYNNEVEIVCNDWQGGVWLSNERPGIDPTGTIPTAGIFGGALAVFLGFLKMSGIDICACDYSQGISLWRPDLEWTASAATGPTIQFLPKRYWILGLGHLGQAYCWNIGLLPYTNVEPCTIVLQDNDRLVEANWSAGLLSEKEDTGAYKTRVSAKWLEDRGFQTVITERLFDQQTRRTSEEPYLALCGFDNAISRLSLEDAGFDLVVEAGLGGNIFDFDQISLHTFPGASRTAREIWEEWGNKPQDFNENVLQVLNDLNKTICGVVPLTIAEKAVSASFVGACTASLVLAETLRALHSGLRFELISMQMRNLANKNAIQHIKGPYTTELSRNGFISF